MPLLSSVSGFPFGFLVGIVLGGRCVLYGIVLTGGITGCLGGEDDCCAAVAAAGAAAAGGVVFTGVCFSSSLSSTQQEKELTLNILSGMP